MPERLAIFGRGGASILLISALSGCIAAAALPAREPGSTALASLTPTAFEAAYARDTARVLYGGRGAERTARFIAADNETGFALCLRAGRDYALLVFQRRIVEAAISQAADDAVVLRSTADTAPCRSAGDWTRA